ncbi:MAG: glutamine amidotransferase [Chthoniobacterales bacterium]
MIVVGSPWVLLALLGLPVLWWIWRGAPDRRRSALLVRLAIFSLLVFALADVGIERSATETAVSVVLDESPSVSADGRKAGNELVQALRGEAGEDRVRVFTIGNEPAGPALLRAAAGRADDRPTRMVFVTDGAAPETATIEIAARKLTAAGVPMDVVRVDREREPEVELGPLIAPPVVQPGQAFDVVANVRANVSGPAEIRLYLDGLLVGEREETLEAGENPITFANVAGLEGGGELRAEVLSVDDTFAENNVAVARIATSRSARVLILDPEPERMEWVAGQLRASKFDVEVRPTDAAPERVEDWNRFDLVVLSDSGAADLGDARMRLLQSWVTNLGGGLVLSGGENAFAAGGYAETPLADLSPVEIAYEDSAELPVSALVIALDRSGSMSAVVGGQTKMALADEGAVRAMDALQSKDLFGVLAVDIEAHPVVPLGPLTDRSLTAERVLSIQAGGGGVYVTTALVAVYRALREVDARIRHVILFSDAADAEEKEAGGFKSLELAGAMLAQRITISVVALGSESDRDTEFLRALAERGGGRFYLTSDALSLPRIFSEETMRATRTNVVETAFQPTVVAVGDEISGIDWENVPFLLGYNATSVKEGSRVLLATERDEPLLAMARVGLGRVAAFTSDLKGRWTSDWVEWPGFGKLIVQVARSAGRGSEASGVTARVAQSGDDEVVVVEARDADGMFLNDADVEVTKLRDSQARRAEQVAAGRYRADFKGGGGGLVGEYSVRVGDRPPVKAVAEAAGVGEFDVLREVGPDLERLAAAGNGELDPPVTDVFRPTGSVVRSVSELAPWFLVGAILLVPVDVWVRRRG